MVQLYIDIDIQGYHPRVGDCETNYSYNLVTQYDNNNNIGKSPDLGDVTDATKGRSTPNLPPRIQILDPPPL